MADDPPKPVLTLASENDHIDPIDRQKERALDNLRWPTREMVANLFRVMRGAGRPHLLPQQILDLAFAVEEADKVSNAWGIWNVMEEVLQSALPDWEDGSDVDGADHTIVRGSLQMLASNLVQQRAQSAAGSRQIHEGIREMERAWERNREEARLGAIRFSKTVARTSRTIKKAAPKAESLAEVPTPPEGRPVSTAEAMRRRARQLAKDVK